MECICHVNRTKRETRDCPSSGIINVKGGNSTGRSGGCGTTPSFEIRDGREVEEAATHTMLPTSDFLLPSPVLSCLLKPGRAAWL